MSENIGLNEYAVKVSNGSGCLFQPMTDEYTYVLTAKHVIQNTDLIEITRQIVSKLDVVIEHLEVIGNPYLHSDPNKDAAIIKVRYIESVDELLRIDDPFSNSTDYSLIGHPVRRRTKPDFFSFRQDKIFLSNVKEYGYIEAQLDPVALHEEVRGLSGGGIVSNSKGRILLAGIQSRMSAEDDNETLGRIDFMPLSFFDEIVEANPDELEELLPPHLKCFSFLKENVMSLEGCFIPNNVDFTREFLRNLTDEIVNSNLTPKYIKDHFKERLLIHRQSKSSLLEKGLWVAWLELLIILRVMRDQSIGDKELEDVFNSLRLIFSNTKRDWSSQFKSIIKSDFRGLDPKGGSIIVSTNSTPAKTVIPSNVIDDIVRGNNVQRGELQIDVGVEHPLKNYKLLHIHAFQKDCIIEKEGEYKDFTSLTEKELLTKLKEEYELLLRS